ncbi:MAG: hypothetical protein IID61_12425 [SAR324 cluster bacterium]|nr:hypothetical protein [SAR324 cluster bacterium]
MASERQIAANRNNALRSTGATSARGKRHSARNALTHGLLSRQTLLKGEDETVFVQVREQLLAELQPEGELETYLAGRVIGGIWRMNRVVRIEAGLFNEAEFPFMEGEKSLSATFKSGCRTGANTFSSLTRYETAIERGVTNALHELQRLQAARKGELVPLPLAVDVNLSGGDAELI